MRCPECSGGRSRVFDTVQTPDAVGRRRRCLGCGSVYYTAERVTKHKPPWRQKRRREQQT